MSDVVLEHASGPTSSRSGRLTGVVLALLLVPVATAVYPRVGWSRMESACSLDGAQGEVHGSVSYGWNWQLLGFRCTYDTGRTHTSLWP